MIEIFKTNVSKKVQANALIKELQTQIPDAVVSFDLEDCDKVLRIEAKTTFNSYMVIKIVNNAEFYCEIMND